MTQIAKILDKIKIKEKELKKHFKVYINFKEMSHSNLQFLLH